VPRRIPLCAQGPAAVSVGDHDQFVRRYFSVAGYDSRGREWIDGGNSGGSHSLARDDSGSGSGDGVEELGEELIDWCGLI